MMKRLMILLALVAGMAFAGCSDDEEVQPKTTAEQIAEQIMALGASTASVYSDIAWDFQNVAFEIKVPFLVVNDKDGRPIYYPLENLYYMNYDKDYDSIILFFE